MFTVGDPEVVVRIVSLGDTVGRGGLANGQDGGWTTGSLGLSDLLNRRCHLYAASSLNVHKLAREQRERLKDKCNKEVEITIDGMYESKVTEGIYKVKQLRGTVGPW